MGRSGWTVEYVDVGRGTSVDLDDHARGIHLLGPFQGVGMPPVDHYSEPTFDVAGELWEQTRFAVREVTLPVAIVAVTEGEVMERLRALAALLRPSNAPNAGYLRFAHRDVGYGARRLWCQYAGGMEGDLGVEIETADTWMTAGLVFRAFDPLFEDDAEQVVDWTTTGTLALPFFPLADDPADFGPHFGSSNIFEARVVGNGGDVTAYPIWDVTGPASSLILTNLTTGQKIDLTRSGGLPVPAGQTLTIDTRPNSRSIVRGDGTNGFPYLTTDSQVWGLAPGQNQISVQAGDAASSSLVRMRLRPRRLTL